MRSKLVSGERGSRRFVLVFETGDNVMEELERFAASEGVQSASFTGIGGFQRVTIGYYDLGIKDYRAKEIAEQRELLSIIGNVAQFGGKPKLHIHVVLGDQEYRAHGGHLIAATVRPTLELFVEELPVTLERRKHPEFCIPLIEF